MEVAKAKCKIEADEENHLSENPECCCQTEQDKINEQYDLGM